MSEITIKSANDQMNLGFLKGMADRMETAFYSYGDYRENYRGRYSRKFFQDMREAIVPLVKEYRAAKHTTANANAVAATLDRLLLYLVGGSTRKGDVDAGNTEYLMDAANFLMIEFSFPQVPRTRFEAGDYMSSPGLVGEGEGEAAVAALHTYGNRQGD